jgi:hypothetical protein
MPEAALAFASSEAGRAAARTRERLAREDGPCGHDASSVLTANVLTADVVDSLEGKAYLDLSSQRFDPHDPAWETTGWPPNEGVLWAASTHLPSAWQTSAVGSLRDADARDPPLT